MRLCYQAIILLLLFGLFDIIFIDSLDFMQTKVFNLSYWQISHAATFFLMALLCPKNLKLFMLWGITWEIMERILGIMTNKQEFWTSGGVHGQLTDLLLNFIGYKLGEIAYPYLRK